MITPRQFGDRGRRRAASLGIEFHDLRPVLRAAGGGCYHPRNLHWTTVGHLAVAESLARTLSNDVPERLPSDAEVGSRPQMPVYETSF